MTALLRTAFCLGVLAASSAAQDDPSPSSALDRLVSDAHEKGDQHGVVIVARGGERILSTATGVAQVSPELPHDLGTRFRIASLTKVLTQAALLRLVDQGNVDLEDPLSLYRPEFDAEIAAQVTLRQLLNMSSGLPRELSPDMEKSGVRFDEEGLAGPFVDTMETSLQFEPGTNFAYSNVGYWVLGAVLEAEIGDTYAQAMKELVFEPLGMEHSGCEPVSVTKDAGAVVAKGYVQKGDQLEPVGPDSVRSRFASGGLYSTAPDLLRFCQALRDDEFLSEGSRAELFGNFRDPRPTGGRIMIAGMLPGFRNVLICDRDDDYAIVLLNNLDISPPDRILRLVQSISAQLESE